MNQCQLQSGLLNGLVQRIVVSKNEDNPLKIMAKLKVSGKQHVQEQQLDCGNSSKFFF
jgi:hypothetical protein